MPMNVQKLVFICLFMTIHHNSLAAAKLACEEFTRPVDNIENFKLEDLVEVPVIMTASQQAACLKTAASIVSVISGEELNNMGARDLIDALQLIPGFNFGLIVTNTVGLGVRGVQADEGKLSVLLDGVILTEQRFGTTVFGSHFPVELIDHIEIIRGPGSILHGNFAEMGVINIITKKGRQLNGGAISGSYGHFEDGEARKTAVINIGKQWNDFESSFYGKFNQSYRSDSIYVDAFGNSFDMSNDNELNSLLGNLHIRYKNLNLRFLVDEYSVDSRDSFAEKISPPDRFSRNTFTTYAAKLDYQHIFNDHIKLDAGIDFSQQTPWKRERIYADHRPDLLREKVTLEHYKFDLKTTLTADQGHYLVIGNSFQFEDYQHDKSSFTGELPLFGNYTVYAEAVYKTKWINILGGLRFDWYSEYSSNFSPRVALTKKIGDFHYKVLYSQAFHAPTGGNFQLNAEYNQNNLDQTIKQLTPEKAYSYELELGYQFMRNLGLSVNFFYHQIDDFFVYSVDKNLQDFYQNSDRLSTWGAEAVLSYQNKQWGKVKLNYGFYQALEDSSNAFKAFNANNNVVHERLNISQPTHKVSLNHHLSISEEMSFNHTLIFLSDRYGYSGDKLVHHDPKWIYNTYLRYQNAFINGLDVGFGVYDVFNAKLEYVQLINGSHPALPGNTREFRVNLSYQF